MFPFASDDLEARSALWSIIARILVQVQENEMNRSSLFQYVSVLVDKSDLVEDELLDCQSDDLSKGHEGLTSSCTKSNARTTAVSCFALVLTVTMTYIFGFRNFRYLLAHLVYLFISTAVSCNIFVSLDLCDRLEG